MNNWHFSWFYANDNKCFLRKITPCVVFSNLWPLMIMNQATVAPCIVNYYLSIRKKYRMMHTNLKYCLITLIICSMNSMIMKMSRYWQWRYYENSIKQQRRMLTQRFIDMQDMFPCTRSRQPHLVHITKHVFLYNCTLRIVNKKRYCESCGFSKINNQG